MFSNKLLCIWGLMIFFINIGEAAKKDVKLFYLIDEAHQFHLENVEELFLQHKLNSIKNNISLGYNVSDIWMKVLVDNLKEEKILAIKNAHLDSISIYIFSGNKMVASLNSGDNLDFDHRYLNNNFFNFLIPATATSITLKIHTKGPMLVPVEFLTYQEYINFYQSRSIFHWIYIGFVALTFISNSILYVWLKESVYIYYSLFLLSIALVTAVDFGYAFQYLWPHQPSVNNFVPYFYLMGIFPLLLTESVLNLKNNSKKFYHIFQFFYLSYLIAAFIFLIQSYNINIQIIFYLTFSSTMISFLAGIYLYTKLKSEYSAFFMIGWIVFMICTLIYIVSVIGLIKYSWFLGNILQIGTVVEIIFFNMAILSRIKLLKKEKEKILAEQNKELEIQVFHRTNELKEKNKIIEEKNILLENRKENLEKLIEERNRELIKANTKLKNKNERLKQYASVTNHNLRGPVATLLGLYNIYNKNAETDPFNLVVVDKAKVTVLQIDNIIKDLNILLDLEEEIEINKVPINLSKQLERITELLKNEIKDSDASIHHNFSKCLIIKSYPRYIKNIFYQFIDNSIKFRKKDVSPIINIESDEDEGNVYLIFKDNGLGIDLEKYGDDIFKPYKKFHPLLGGRGIGLSVVKRQIEAMRGSIEVLSKPDEGTTFIVKIKK